MIRGRFREKTQSAWVRLALRNVWSVCGVAGSFMLVEHEVKAGSSPAQSRWWAGRAWCASPGRAHTWVWRCARGTTAEWRGLVLFFTDRLRARMDLGDQQGARGSTSGPRHLCYNRGPARWRWDRQIWELPSGEMGETWKSIVRENSAQGDSQAAWDYWGWLLRQETGRVRRATQSLSLQSEYSR